MNDYEHNTFRITETARAVRIERYIATADDWAEYEEWLDSLPDQGEDHWRERDAQRNSLDNDPEPWYHDINEEDCPF
jgi:hypothetical protein